MDVLSTRDLAAAIGVSESSIKRWADDGVIRSSRTAGGHRRIPLAEAIRFVRETHATLVRPQLLGLPEAALAAVDGAARGDGTERLHDYLMRGAGAHARGLLLHLYLSGQSFASIIDGPLRAALERIGESWRHDPNGVFLEHRATEICMQALQQLRLLCSPPGASRAVGGAPEGDPYLIPSLAAATVLAGEGFEAVNLGAETPFDALERAMTNLTPRLVWITVSVAPQPERTAREIARLARAFAPAGVHLAVGGRAAAGLRLPTLPNLQLAATMAELAAFARGLALAGSAPA